jgi:hypothetical protein
MLSPEEEKFFGAEARKQTERCISIIYLLSTPFEMVDITAFCPVCKQYSLRFRARQISRPDEAETFTKYCINNCKVK